MLLLARPPYLRWVAACLLVIGALAWDLSRRATEPFPFAADEITRGEPITDATIEWVPVPRGSLTMPDLNGVHATTDIAAGDPITRSVAGSDPVIPDGWWSVPMDLPVGVLPGARVRLTSLDGLQIEGIVSIPASEDQFGLTAPGAVAVPDEAVTAVSLAVATDTLVIVVAP